MTGGADIAWPSHHNPVFIAINPSLALAVCAFYSIARHALFRSANEVFLSREGITGTVAARALYKYRVKVEHVASLYFLYAIVASFI